MKTLFSLTLIGTIFLSNANPISQNFSEQEITFSTEVSFNLIGNWCDGSLTLEANSGEEGTVYRWMKDGIVIKGADSKSLNLNDHGLGNYTVSIQSKTGNTFTDSYDFTSAPGPFSNFQSVNHPPIGATRFADQSTPGDMPIVGWHWDFGDGTSSIEKNPEHFYGEQKIYNVVLTTTDSNGCSNSVTIPVEWKF